MEKNKKTVSKRKQGSVGEDAAVQFILAQGYRLFFRNYRVSRFGEIDIIALDHSTICFIEVKARTSIAFGLPREAVTHHKRETIRLLASYFLGKYPEFSNHPVRFDVVEIIHRKEKDNFVIEHIEIIKNAF